MKKKPSLACLLPIFFLFYEVMFDILFQILYLYVAFIDLELRKNSHVSRCTLLLLYRIRYEGERISFVLLYIVLIWICVSKKKKIIKSLFHFRCSCIDCHYYSKRSKSKLWQWKLVSKRRIQSFFLINRKVCEY